MQETYRSASACLVKNKREEMFLPRQPLLREDLRQREG